MYRIRDFINSMNINHEVYPSVQYSTIFLQKQIIRLLMITELQYESQLLPWMWIVTGSYVYACMHTVFCDLLAKLQKHVLQDIQSNKLVKTIDQLHTIIHSSEL